MIKAKEVDVVVVGAGFAGIYMLYKLKNLGFTSRVIERGDGVGGTWHWNRYPGARCDIPSLQYSYQFDDELQQEWEWEEKYSSQKQILEYANHVVDRFDLRNDITFNTEVQSTTYNEEQGRWTVKTSQEEIVCSYCVMATGCLSQVNEPNIPGIENFKGELLHTGKWPHSDINFEGKNISIIGTGSSSIQSIPIIAESAKTLTVFQRTANYSIPSNNGPMDPAEEAEIKSRYKDFREENWQNGFGIAGLANELLATETPDDEIKETFSEHWDNSGLGFLGAYADLMLDPNANEIAASFVRDKIKEIVNDPDTADNLCPDHTIGCKRLCVDTDYYETFNKPNVSLINIKKDPILDITENSVTTEKNEFETDMLILATGFDAMTGALTNIDITGKNGNKLSEVWANGAKSYLGLGISGFPNLFMVTGPGSPSVLSNMLPSIEQHVEWIANCLVWMRDNNKSIIESTESAEEEWMQHVKETSELTLYTTCNSWYNGSNLEGKSKTFLPYVGVPPYAEKCEEVSKENYQGFVFDKSN
tara:strand:+ start:5639 stop:7237 length:1599 start_codon:yes stop_codon:yes gene_type:complete